MNNLLQPGFTIGGKYRLEKRLGAGSMGSVWAARNQLTDRTFAIKFMLPEFAQDPTLVQRFLNEAKVCGRLDHPSIVEIYDLGVADELQGVPFLVMELLRGEGLDALLDRARRLDPRGICSIIVEIASALDQAHQAGIVHRDVKPSNIFLHRTRSGDVTPKLLDFGVSKVLEASDGDFDITRVGSVLGSPLYMSPEQARGQSDIDQRADLWALGVVLYEAIAGDLPFAPGNYNAVLSAILTSRHRPLRDVVPGLPLALCDAVELCLVKDRNRRMASAAQLVTRLEAVLLHLAPASLRSSLPSVPATSPAPAASPAAPAAPAASPAAPSSGAASSASSTTPSARAARRPAAEPAPVAPAAPATPEPTASAPLADMAFDESTEVMSREDLLAILPRSPHRAARPGELDSDAVDGEEAPPLSRTTELRRLLLAELAPAVQTTKTDDISEKMPVAPVDRSARVQRIEQQLQSIESERRSTFPPPADASPPSEPAPLSSSEIHDDSQATQVLNATSEAIRAARARLVSGPDAALAPGAVEPTPPAGGVAPGDAAPATPAARSADHPELPDSGDPVAPDAPDRAGPAGPEAPNHAGPAGPEAPDAAPSGPRPAAPLAPGRRGNRMWLVVALVLAALSLLVLMRAR